MELQITTLIENEQDDKGLLCFEHGLSLYLEFRGKKVLFDTGQTGAFVENAGKLGKSLKELDAIIVSHGHYDHSGGMMKLLQQLAGKVPLYVGAEFFDKKYKKLPDGSWHYNGNPFSEKDLLSFPIDMHKVTEDVAYITEDIILFKNFEHRTDYEKPNPKFYVQRKDSRKLNAMENEGEKRHMDCLTTEEEGQACGYELDDFRDEIALGLRTTKGLVLIAGCSHVGIINILETVKNRLDIPIYCVLGGTHLVEADEERIHRTLEDLKRLKVQHIAVSHCTGEVGVGEVKAAFPQGFIRNNTGNVVRI